jgi:HTH-type transcriptional repressor of NAD biosynthesis genes
MEKRFKKGLVLGKFMPPHNGHLHLINTAAVCCDKLFVMIGSLKNEPINGILRYNWLKNIYEDNKNIEIIHVTDENPQKPEECDSLDTFYNDFWVPTVKSRVSDLDVIFTSESYGDEFAQYLGIEHVLVDIDRKVVPVSGTMVRNDPFKHWLHVPDVVKPYYTKRIAILGPESTGKTTLTKLLSKYYNVDCVLEYGRTYTETIKESKKLEKEDFLTIAKVHNDDILEAHVDTTKTCLFIDTDAVTTKLFGKLYIEGYEDERVDEIIRYQWFDLTLLMDVDVDWVDDGNRDFPNDRQRHFNMIKDELDRLGRKYVIINGNYSERFDKAKKEVDKLGYL